MVRGAGGKLRERHTVRAVMLDQPKHPDAEALPHPTERHGGEHGIPPNLPDEQPTGTPSDDRHQTEITPTKDQNGRHADE